MKKIILITSIVLAVGCGKNTKKSGNALNQPHSGATPVALGLDEFEQSMLSDSECMDGKRKVKKIVNEDKLDVYPVSTDLENVLRISMYLYDDRTALVRHETLLVNKIRREIVDVVDNGQIQARWFVDDKDQKILVQADDIESLNLVIDKPKTNYDQNRPWLRMMNVKGLGILGYRLNGRGARFYINPSDQVSCE